MDRLLRARMRPLSRPRLVSRLEADDALPITVIRAGSGFGKSTLLVDWIRHSAGAVVPLTVLPALTERVSFWRAMCDAAAGDSRQTERARIRSVPAVEPTENTLVEGLLRSVTESDATRIAIDNFDRLDCPKQIADDLRRLLELAPRLKVVLATRSSVPFERAQERMRLDVAILEHADLRFTNAEITTALRRAGVEVPSFADLVARASDRIPELVLFSALELADQPEISDLDRVEAWLTERVDNYVLESLTPADRLVEDLSAADIVSLELAADLVGTSEAIGLDMLERLGLGSRERRMLDGEASVPVFAFSPPLLRALRSRARSEDPVRFMALRLKFAHWARERGLYLEALQASVDAQDFDLASAIVTDYWFELGGHRAEVLAALGGLTRRTLTTWPLLAVELALSYLPIPDHQWKAAELFTIAVAGIGARRGGTTPTERLVYVLLEMVASRTLLGSYRRAGQLAERLGRMIAEFPAADYESAKRLMPRAITQIAATQLFSGNEQAALLTLLSGTVSAQSKEGQERAQYFALSLRAGAHALAGELDDAERFYRISDGLVGEEHRHNDYSGSMARLAEAMLAAERGEYKKALEVMSRLHIHYGTIENVHLLVQTETWAYLGTDPERGLDWASEVLRTVPRQRRVPDYGVASLKRSIVRSALAVGDLATAQQHLKATTAIGSTAHATLAAQVELARGSHERALALLLRNPPRERVGLRDALEHDLALVIASSRNGQTDAALVRLRTLASTLTSRRLSLPVIAFTNNGLSELLDLAGQANVVGLGERLSDLRPRDARTRPRPRLTPREHAVLLQLLDGGSYADIARELVVSINTVRSQVRSLYRKLEVSSREDALKSALELHLFDDHGPKPEPGDHARPRPS